jgi:hypothetical protein
MKQVLVGALLGIVLGYCWFRAYYAANVQKLLRFICNTWVFQWLRIRFVEGNMIFLLSHVVS